MIQHLYLPTNGRLKQLVNFMSYVEFTAEDAIDSCKAIFPNATSNLVISLNSTLRLNQSDVLFSLYASCTSAVAIKPFVGMKFLTVQFNHYGLYFLSRTPAHELCDSLLGLDYFFSNRELDQLGNELDESSSLYQQFVLLEQFLANQLELEQVDERLSAATHLIHSTKEVRSKTLTEKLCLSERAVQKLFKERIGMSPSKLKKIIRFNLAAQRLLNDESKPLSDLALECGYYDQSHFIKDFKRFATISPSEFVKHKAKNSEFYNFNLQSPDRLGA